MAPILLFDIDGTILHVKRSFMKEVMIDIYGRFNVRPEFLKNISFAGRTDKDIFTELSSYHIHISYSELKKLYIREMGSRLSADHIEMIPGAMEAVNRAVDKGIDVGLCTGNFREVAKIKMKAAGLNGIFPFGGYGCSHEDRIDLPGEADRSYRALRGKKPLPEQYVVIGDTPNDIRCARHFGARAVAVTTGGFKEEELQKHLPDYICDGLGNLDRWLAGD